MALENLDWDNFTCEKRFIWMRHTWNTIDKVKVSFLGNYVKYLDEISNKKSKKLMSGLFIEVIGYRIFVAKNPKDLGKKYKSIDIGEFVALSSWNNRSIDYISVELIVFDEFITEGTGYIKNEYEAIMYLFDSMIRENNEIKIIMLANSITANHPLLAKLGISKLEQGYTHIWKDHIKWVTILYYPPSHNLKKKRDNTLIGFLGNLSDYNSMSNDNEMKNDCIVNIQNTDYRHLSPYITISVDGVHIYLWLYENYGTYRVHVSNKKHDQKVVSLKNKFEEGVAIKNKQIEIFKNQLINWNYNMEITYNTLEIKELFYKIL